MPSYDDGEPTGWTIHPDGLVECADPHPENQLLAILVTAIKRGDDRGFVVMDYLAMHSADIFIAWGGLRPMLEAERQS